MSAPIKVYIVEMLTAEEVKPILVTAEREEAEAMVEAFNDVQHELGRDNESPRLPMLHLRSGLCFYQASPCLAGKEVLA